MSQGLAEGAQAPTFTLPCAGGGQVSLDDFAQRKLVLFFYPKADTPGCTQEAADFSQLAKYFEHAKTAVLGVSPDPVRALDRFRQKHRLAVPLASDESHAVLEAYGVWGKKMMFGRRYMGVIRTTFLIAPGGRIHRIWHKVSVQDHAQEVLAAAKAL